MKDMITVLTHDGKKIISIDRNYVFELYNKSILYYEIGCHNDETKQETLDVFETQEQAKIGMEKLFKSINDKSRGCSLLVETDDIDIDKVIKEYRNKLVIGE